MVIKEMLFLKFSNFLLSTNHQNLLKLTVQVKLFGIKSILAIIFSHTF